MVQVVKSLPADAGGVRDAGSIPESGGSPGGGPGNSLPYSCLQNPMDRGAWWAIVHGVTKSQTRPKLTWHACTQSLLNAAHDFTPWIPDVLKPRSKTKA